MHVRDASERGLEADDAAARGWEANRSRPVGAERQRCLARGDGGRARRRTSRPRVRERSHGLRVAPNSGLSVSGLWPNSGVVVLPTRIAPASRKPADGDRVSRPAPGRRRSASPSSSGTPWVNSRSLTENGTPWSGPRSRPPSRAASARRAASRASSAVTVMNAFTLGCRASIRCEHGVHHRNRPRPASVRIRRASVSASVRITASSNGGLLIHDLTAHDRGRHRDLADLVRRLLSRDSAPRITRCTQLARPRSCPFTRSSKAPRAAFAVTVESASLHRDTLRIVQHLAGAGHARRRALHAEERAHRGHRAVGVEHRPDARAEGRADRIQHAHAVGAEEAIAVAIAPVVDVVREEVRE